MSNQLPTGGKQAVLQSEHSPWNLLASSLYPKVSWISSASLTLNYAATLFLAMHFCVSVAIPLLFWTGTKGAKYRSNFIQNYIILVPNTDTNYRDHKKFLNFATVLPYFLNIKRSGIKCCWIQTVSNLEQFSCLISNLHPPILGDLAVWQRKMERRQN